MINAIKEKKKMSEYNIALQLIELESSLNREDTSIRSSISDISSNSNGNDFGKFI